VKNADGEPIGAIRGIFGVKESGEKVFFGKYIDQDGRFRGIFAGSCAEGELRGRWLTRTGDAGELGGRYVESIPGAETGGHFLGHWAETRCEAAPERP
jgi:hypothetical protein